MEKIDWGFLAYFLWFVSRILKHSWGNVSLIILEILFCIIIYPVNLYVIKLIGKGFNKLTKIVTKSNWYKLRCAKRTIKKIKYFNPDDILWGIRELSEEEINDLVSNNKFLVLAQHWLSMNNLCIGTHDSLADCIATVMKFKKDYADTDDFVTSLYIGNKTDFFFVYTDGKVLPISDDIKVLKRYYKNISEDELKKMLKKAQVLADLQ